MALFGVAVRHSRRHYSDAGESIIYIMVIYAHSGNKGESELLLQSIEEWAGAYRSHPLFIVGDFNRETNESATLQRWEEGGTLTDIHKELEEANGREPVATVFNTTGRERRLDMIWGNRMALGLVESTSTEVVFATHRTISITLKMEEFRKGFQVRMRPPPLDTSKEYKLIMYLETLRMRPDERILPESLTYDM